MIIRSRFTNPFSKMIQSHKLCRLYLANCRYKNIKSHLAREFLNWSKVADGSRYSLRKSNFSFSWSFKCIISDNMSVKRPDSKADYSRESTLMKRQIAKKNGIRRVSGKIYKFNSFSNLTVCNLCRR